MFERISDRWKKDASGALRLGVIAAASIVTATVTLCFFGAAAFVIALQRYGLVDACLAGAGVFLRGDPGRCSVYTRFMSPAAVAKRKRAQLWSRRPYPRWPTRGSFWPGFRLSRRSASSGSS
jgi:hypothetical protein